MPLTKNKGRRSPARSKSYRTAATMKAKTKKTTGEKKSGPTDPRKPKTLTKDQLEYLRRKLRKKFHR